MEVTGQPLDSPSSHWQKLVEGEKSEWSTWVGGGGHLETGTAAFIPPIVEHCPALKAWWGKPYRELHLYLVWVTGTISIINSRAAEPLS